MSTARAVGKGAWLVAGLGVGVFLLLALSVAWGQDGSGAHGHGGHVHPPAGAEGGSFFGDLLRIYTPRQVCMFYEAPVIWLHVISDALIALAYYSIPFALVYFVWRRKDVAFGWVFWLFAAFILACGTTHLFGVIDIWHPFYRLDGVIKMITALLSIATAVALWPLIPQALAVRSPAQLEQVVQERTVELASVNRKLREEVAARAAGEEAKARLAAIVESSDDAIISKTLEGTVLTWNHGAERLYGYAAEEIVGRPVSALVPPDLMEEEREVMRRLGRDERMQHFETVRVAKDGRRLDVAITLSPIKDGQGRIVGASTVARDITQRKRMQESLGESRRRLEGIINSAMDAIISVDESQRIVLFNPAAEKMFRCPASEAIGSLIDRFIPHRFRAAHREHIARFGTTGQTARAMGKLGAISGLRTNGEEFPIEASISQVDVGGGKLFSVILRDITERKRAEEELLRWQAELEHRVEQRTAELAAANKELEAFGYSVSHDLRAPLRHVMGFIDILKKHAGPAMDEQGQRYLQVIGDAGRRMGNLIDDLLTLSRIGRATIAETEVDLGQLVAEARAELAPETKERTIEWQIDRLPTVVGDRTLLRTVMVNLLSNAIKYSQREDTARIEIGCREAGDEVICFVRDNGVGFDMSFVDKLFGVFQRLHTREEFEGTGIGLASVRRIIQRHGGRTWAEGEVGQGATVYFSLPESKVIHERRESGTEADSAGGG